MGDWFDDGGSGQQVDVAAVFDGNSLPALLAVVQLGALVSLGTTSDGGALGVTVTVDGRWKRTYVRRGEELEDWLSEALPAVRAAVEATSASSAPRGRRRGARGL